MNRIYAYIDDHSERMVAELFTLLKQPSVSSHGIGIDACAALLAGMMQEAGIRTEILAMGGASNPPLVYGELLSPGAGKTVLIYGHFDVQPPDPVSEWETPPFEPVIRDGRIYARGAADNKGQLFAHIKAVEAILKTCDRFPVNLKFLCDPEEEIGSPRLEAYVKEHADRFSADLVYNSDASLDVSGRPLLCFGNRGNCHVEINHREANRDLHSGQYGGVVTNPNWLVIRFLDTLMDDDGRIAIDGFYDTVVPPTPAEQAAMSAIPFDAGRMLADLGIKAFAGPKDVSFWEKIMFRPTLEICGYSSGYGGKGSKTVLPSRVNVKISMRLVKNQTPQEAFDKLTAHAEKHGFGDLDIRMHSFYYPSKTRIDHPVSTTIIDAVKQAFGAEPILFPSIGGSNPSSIFTEFMGLPFIKVPYGNHDDNAHSPNENLRVDLFIKGIKTSASVFCALGG